MTRRQRKIESLIRQELSELIKQQVKDPRLRGLITVTEVCISPDLKHATVFISTLSSEGEVLQGLSSASGFLRRELGKRVLLRNIPELSFERDDSIERGTHLLRLFEQLSTESTDRG
jgi:ribosome-binding factor A